MTDRGAGRQSVPLIHRPSLGAARAATGLLAKLVASAGFLAVAGVRAQELGSGTPSVVLLTYGSVVVVERIAFARMPDRGSPLRQVAGALAVFAAGAGVAALTDTIPALLLAAALIGVGMSLLTPPFFAAVFAAVFAGAASAAVLGAMWTARLAARCLDEVAPPFGPTS